MSLSPAPQLYSRIIIENITPEIDGGRYPIKRVEGDRVEVAADVYMDGHDLLKCTLCYRKTGEKTWQESPLDAPDNDRWHGSFVVSEVGRYEYTVKAWPDLFGSWLEGVRKKRDAGLDIKLELQEGAILVATLLGDANKAATKEAIAKPKKAKAEPDVLDALRDSIRDHTRPQFAEYILGDDVVALMDKHARRLGEVTYPHILGVKVDRTRAAFSAWYEMFPRSQGSDPTKSGTFADCEARLPDIHAMGFNVIYFPPIHPIGHLHRKGRNNSLTAGKGDPGSPYAIGAPEGGHKHVHPELGTLDDFRHFVKKAASYGMDVALDFAIQVSRDHPYIKSHPEWFSFRPDGSIHYAENPPKKYEDIANFNFEGGPALWEELRAIVWFWIEQGVTIFRVDNPHTKPFAFWEWLITSIQDARPDIIFLSEAFTRPKRMYLLAKAGFTQSYTYFTWRHGKAEFIEYMTELTQSEVRDFFRPNFFPTTPDILPPYLQVGGRPAFLVRLALAATLSGNYGMVAGYELLEGEGVPGKEEYIDSEKYEIKPRNWNAPGNIIPFVTALNRIRRDNPAMQDFLNLAFYPSSNANIIFYGKIAADKKNAVFVAVNLDYAAVHEAFIELPLAELGIGADDSVTLDDLLQGHSWQWQGARQHIRLDPASNPVAIFRINRP